MSSYKKMVKGYQSFRKKYVHGNRSIMKYLSYHGQQPEVMVVACCDSRVDPALILQCDPGDLFIVRNVANIVPPYEKDEMHHGTSAALEFGVRFLKVKHLILLGHSQCGGIQALLNRTTSDDNDFITPWVSVLKTDHNHNCSIDEFAKLALSQSYENCLKFPWIQDKVTKGELIIHRWFFDIKAGQIFEYFDKQNGFKPLDISNDLITAI